MKKASLSYHLFALFAGAFAAIPLVLETLPFLSFLAFVPYFLFLCTRKKECPLRFYYLSGLFFFLGYYMGAFSFFCAMYPLDFAGLDTGGSIAVLFAAMVLLPLFQAWFSAFAVFFVGLLKKRDCFCFPLAFSLALSALYTLFSFAQNLTWAGVPWANPAIGIASSPLLIQGASLFGNTFLVFFIVFCNAALAEGFVLFRDCRDKGSLICVGCAALLFFSQIALGAGRLSTPKNAERQLTVAVIQGSFPATENTYLSAHLRTCRHEARLAAKEAKVDLMLWSESVLTFALEAREEARTFFSEIAVETNAIQVIGAFSSTPTEEGEEGYYNSLFLFYPDGTVSREVYHKQRPVPFGEYVPMAWLFERIIPALTEISMLERGTTPGKDSSLFHTEAGTFGSLICFDSIYPALARRSVLDGAELLLVSTDDSWFDGSFAKSLHFRHAVLRAVENGRSVVRTGNTGRSGVIDSRGEVFSTVPTDIPTHGITTVALSNENTLYSAVGEVFLIFCLGTLILLPFAAHRPKRGKKG